MRLKDIMTRAIDASRSYGVRYVQNAIRGVVHAGRHDCVAPSLEDVQAIVYLWACMEEGGGSREVALPSRRLLYFTWSPAAALAIVGMFLFEVAAGLPRPFDAVDPGQSMVFHMACKQVLTKEAEKCELERGGSEQMAGYTHTADDFQRLHDQHSKGSFELRMRRLYQNLGCFGSYTSAVSPSCGEGTGLALSGLQSRQVCSRKEDSDDGVKSRKGPCAATQMNLLNLRPHDLFANFTKPSFLYATRKEDAVNPRGPRPNRVLHLRRDLSIQTSSAPSKSTTSSSPLLATSNPEASLKYQHTSPPPQQKPPSPSPASPYPYKQRICPDATSVSPSSNSTPGSLPTQLGHCTCKPEPKCWDSAKPAKHYECMLLSSSNIRASEVSDSIQSVDALRHGHSSRVHRTSGHSTKLHGISRPMRWDDGNDACDFQPRYGNEIASKFDLNLCSCGSTLTNEDALRTVTLWTIDLAFGNPDLAASTDGRSAAKFWFQARLLCELENRKIFLPSPFGFDVGFCEVFDVGHGVEGTDCVYQSKFDPDPGLE
ncbi:uncharacterized protein MYCFIDRAFT_172868 [Pseudocercospora fijiensis CIRAD86]|uniref:Uncharacterized protein n=1 Tax=Pseudocercospora fijiensis (strain CIRAD86) TaxID=383855 RepID=M3B349_PSEFD|nr:uncharacterized protein MYCFIDRAFT_172868 [Pseudocercospora fijiensis CIRAD86]EME83792.1 hypothetical protein MYCFIDRAFT_172868 [Pseudocercospora fijiensis CIRAD86]